MAMLTCGECHVQIVSGWAPSSWLNIPADVTPVVIIHEM